MNALALALLCCGSGSALAQLPTTPISITCRAMTVDRALAALSKASGVKLETNELTAHDVIVISVQNVPLSELMRRIGTVTSADWTSTGSGYKLVATERLRRQEDDDALAARTAAVKKSIDKALHPPKPAPGDAKAEQAQAVAQADGAVAVGQPDSNSRRVYEVLATVDPAAIAAVGPNERLVFATRPTSMQRAFGDDISSIVNEIIAQHNADIKKNPQPETNPLENSLDEKTAAIYKGMTDRMSKPIGAVSKVLLVISRLGFGGIGMTQADLRMYDPDGKIVYDQSVNLEMPGSGFADYQDQIQALVTNSPKPAGSAKSTPVEMSPDTKEFEAGFDGSVMMGGRALKLSPTLKHVIFNPDKFDPLSFLATDEILSTAKLQNKPVVAVIPDDALSVLAEVMPGKTQTVEQFEKRLSVGNPMRQVADSSWLVIKPSFPSESRSSRLDRDALATLMHAAESSPLVSLDDIAAYSLRAPSPMEGGIGELYVMYFVPGVFSQGLSGFTSWEAMRVYGSLDSARRETLLSGGRIPFLSLTAYQMDQVRRMAYGAMPMLEIEDPSTKASESLPSYVRMFMGGTLNDYRDEATEILPNGIPSDGFLTMKTSTEPIALPEAPEGSMVPGMSAILDAESLATYKMLRDAPTYGAMSSMLPNPSHIRIGQRTIYEMAFHIAPKVSVHSNLNDNHLDPNSPLMAMSSLPSDFQKLIDQKLAEIKKSPLGAMMMNMGAMSASGGIHP